MKCAICRNGQTETNSITVVLEKKGSTLIVKNVPAEVCDNCGEEYLSSGTNKILQEKAHDAIHRGIDLELLKYAA